MGISDKEVRGIARLARLAVADEEVHEMSRQLGAILDFANQLDAADTEGVEPMAHPMDVAARLRRDEVTEEITREAFQKIAPATTDDLYLVPQVIE